MKKMGLGRGLDALLPEAGDQENLVSMIDITELDRNPDQPGGNLTKRRCRPWRNP